MKKPISMIKKPLLAIEQWFLQTPLRSLDLAFDAALAIKAIEDQHFNGGKISQASSGYGDTVYSHFEADLRRNLDIIKVRLTEFRNSRSVADIYLQTFTPKKRKPGIGEPANGNGKAMALSNQDKLIIDKLAFIDEVVARYHSLSPALTPDRIFSSPATSLASLPNKSGAVESVTETPRAVPGDMQSANFGTGGAAPGSSKPKNIVDQTSFLPRSILRTLDRFKRELDPKAEDEVVQDFRKSKTKTVISLKFVLLIILIPLLTQQIAKNFIVSPIYDIYVGDATEVFINVDMEAEALEELKRYEEKLRFEKILAAEMAELHPAHEAKPLLTESEAKADDTKEPAPSHKWHIENLSEAEIETKIREKAGELAEEYQARSADAIKNVFADIFSAIAVMIFLAKSRRQIAIFRTFLDEVVYGLSDSAKAFIIILFTDIFVGFHSPHGWEIILEGMSRHLGLPENREFIFLFIATFPVILDTVFKYWIFRYLNRISPSAVATYKNMNE